MSRAKGSRVLHGHAKDLHAVVPRSVQSRVQKQPAGMAGVTSVEWLLGGATPVGCSVAAWSETIGRGIHGFHDWQLHLRRASYPLSYTDLCQLFVIPLSAGNLVFLHAEGLNDPLRQR